VLLEHGKIGIEQLTEKRQRKRDELLKKLKTKNRRKKAS